MLVNDPIADMLTRIRNAQIAKHDSVMVPASNMKKSIAKILLDEGYIKSVDLIDDGLAGQIKIGLKYTDKKQSVIVGLKRISKPGLRVYAHDDAETEERTMSRIGRAPIAIPAGVTVTVSDDNIVTVKGPKGTLTQEVNKNITVKQEGNEILVSRPDDEKQNRAFHGLYRALIHNMVVGVSTGFTKTLNLVGTGYRAEAKGNTLNITIGYSHPVIIEAEENIAFATPNQTTITVSGINKQQVGNVAAAIRAVRKPEPYHGKGIKYDTEVVRRKEGKTGKK